MMHVEGRKLEPTPASHTQVCVPTASAVVYQPENPYLILVGRSSKHAAPVLPGGKIDADDLKSCTLAQAAAVCIRRELREEIGVSVDEVVPIGVRNDPEADVRVVPIEKLIGTLVSSAVEDLQPGTLVIAHFGVPDYLFAVSVDRELIRTTEELHELRWIDCRTVGPQSLGAGHYQTVKQYLERLSSGD